jgi:hypothetical protein
MAINLIGLLWKWQSTLEGCCENANELYSFMKYGEFLYLLRKSYFLKKENSMELIS